MSEKIKNKIGLRYEELTGLHPDVIMRLPKSGSDRMYFRVSSSKGSAIAVFNPVKEENEAFVGFARHFRKKGLNVPEIYGWYPDDHIYFQQDLGDINLYQHIRDSDLGSFNDGTVLLYKKVLDHLIRFQTEGTAGLDFTLCYPHKSFDRKSMMWDLNYFKYMFLKLIAVPFNEGRLEKDFETLTSFLLNAGEDFFLYRDFQSANIMIVNGEPWFIDFQGGRRGAPQYDVVSLLFDAKAGIPGQLREILTNYYVDNFCNITGRRREEFNDFLNGFAAIRLMQALGAFGFRGLYEQKPTFVQSIIPAVRLLNQCLDEGVGDLVLHELKRVMFAIPALEQFNILEVPERLRVTVKSFSYSNGIPDDKVHGGGFIFDCRGLVSTRKLKDFRNMNGRDRRVALFMEEDTDVKGFISDTLNLVKRSVKSYKERNYTSLLVAFGCSTGTIRSVYCAERCFAAIKDIEGIDTILIHTEIPE